MNANELAEQLDEYVGNNGYSHNDYADSMSQAATMLRQQQAEIESLKTHPAELTDEEIISTMVQFDVYSSDDHCLIEAGRAILRKAKEK